VPDYEAEMSCSRSKIKTESGGKKFNELGAYRIKQNVYICGSIKQNV